MKALSKASAVPPQGGWANDLKQGLGRKVYANGDVYSGLWAAGKCEGPGRYRWRNGNEYNGEWRAGCMHGQGTLRWSTGAPPPLGNPRMGLARKGSSAKLRCMPRSPPQWQMCSTMHCS